MYWGPSRAVQASMSHQINCSISSLPSKYRPAVDGQVVASSGECVLM